MFDERRYIVANNIKNIRQSLGLNQAEFGKLIGETVHTSTISLWETGNITPNANNLKKIARIGKTRVDKLFSPPEKIEHLSLDKKRAKVLHAALYMLLSKPEFVRNNRYDANLLIEIDDKAKEIMNYE